MDLIELGRYRNTKPVYLNITFYLKGITLGKVVNVIMKKK